MWTQLRAMRVLHFIYFLFLVSLVFRLFEYAFSEIYIHPNASQTLFIQLLFD